MPTTQKLTLILLLLITAIWALVILPCSLLAVSTVFLTDGHPDPDAFALIFFGSLGFPVAIVVFTALAWLAYFFKKYWLALGLIPLPILILIFPILGFSRL